MKFRNGHHHMFDLLFILALFCVFAASGLFIVIIGSKVYKSTINQMQDNYQTRTSLSYVCEKIRQNDTKNALSIETINHTTVLVLTQNYEDTPIKTYIYQQEGFLKELFITENQIPDLSSGQNIMEIEDFEIEKIEPHLYHFISTDTSGRTTDIYLSPKCEEETVYE